MHRGDCYPGDAGVDDAMGEWWPEVNIDTLKLCETKPFDLVCDFVVLCVEKPWILPAALIVGQGACPLANLNCAFHATG